MIVIEKLVKNSPIHDFKSSIKLGKIGETIIEFLMGYCPKVSSIVSVAGDPIYQQDDIDFIVTFKDGSVKTLEVKTDTYDVNFFYELISNDIYNTPGCMVKTKADIVAYYFINLEVIYFIDRKDFQNWFEKHKNDFILDNYGLREYIMKTKVLSNKDKSGLGTYNSKGKVFPITYFEKTFDGFVQKCVLHNIPYESLIIKALTSDN